MPIRQLFSQKLRQRRTELKISQTDLAMAAGVHRTSIGAYEDGKRTSTLGAGVKCHFLLIHSRPPSTAAHLQ
jgi:DNA-binding XRE family transcriptional regulator